MHQSTQRLITMTLGCLTSHFLLCLSIELTPTNTLFFQASLQTGTACQGKLHKPTPSQPLKGTFHTVIHNIIIIMLQYNFRPKIIFQCYIMFLYQKYSLMHQDYSRARISSISLSYVEIFKIKAIEVLIL